MSHLPHLGDFDFLRSRTLTTEQTEELSTLAERWQALTKRWGIPEAPGAFQVPPEEAMDFHNEYLPLDKAMRAFCARNGFIITKPERSSHRDPVAEVREAIKRRRTIIDLLRYVSRSDFQREVNILWDLWRDHLPEKLPPKRPSDVTDYQSAHDAIDLLQSELDRLLPPARSFQTPNQARTEQPSNMSSRPDRDPYLLRCVRELREAMRPCLSHRNANAYRFYAGIWYRQLELCLQELRAGGRNFTGTPAVRRALSDLQTYYDYRKERAESTCEPDAETDARFAKLFRKNLKRLERELQKAESWTGSLAPTPSMPVSRNNIPTDPRIIPPELTATEIHADSVLPAGCNGESSPSPWSQPPGQIDRSRNMSADELRLRRLLEALQDWQHVAKMKSLYRLGHNQALSEQLDPESLGGSRWLVEAHDGNEDLIRRGIISESDLKEKQNHRKEAVEKARKALDILDREGERGESLLESLEVDSSPLSDFLRHEKNRSATIALAVAAEKAIRRALARQNVGKIDGPEAKNPEGSGVLWQPASPVEKVGLKATGMDRRDAPESKPTPLTEDLPATLEGLLCWLSSRVQWLRSWHLSQDPKPIPPPFLEAIIRVCRGDPGVIPTEPEPLRCWANERIWRFSQLTLQQIHVCLENLGIYDSPLLRPINPLTDENCLVEVLDQLTALRAFVALRAGTFVVPRTPEPQGRSDAVPSVSPDTIVSLGDRVYMINGTRQVVNDTEDDVLQAYLGDENRPAVSRLTEPDLIKRSGVNDPMKVLRVLRNKYEELFKLALNPPQKKGAGWGVRIIRNAE